MGFVRDTWIALLAPRRAAIVAVVGLPLLLAQAAWNPDPASGVLAGLLLILSALATAPAAWLWLAGRAGGAWIYAGGCLGAAVLAGLVIPRWAGFEDRFLTQPVTLPLVAGLFAAAGLGLGRDIGDGRRLQAAEARAEALARDRERAELLALRAQLDPHSLYNTLSAIAEWCHTDPMEAERAILRLADLLRGVQRGVQRAAWPLAEEWAICSALLDLYRARDPGRYAWTLDTGGAIPELEVPPLLLLPLVENALKHGPAAGHAGAVQIRFTPAGAGVVVEIRNPGAWGGSRRAGGATGGATGGGAGGEGLALVRRRLALACPEGRLEIGTEPGGGTLARLWLPGPPEGAA